MNQIYQRVYDGYSKMSIEELTKKKAELESDLEYSYEKLNDSKIDYNDRTEIINSDIPYDKMNIEIINAVLKNVYGIESTGRLR